MLVESDVEPCVRILPEPFQGLEFEEPKQRGMRGKRRGGLFALAQAFDFRRRADALGFSGAGDTLLLRPQQKIAPG